MGCSVCQDEALLDIECKPAPCPSCNRMHAALPPTGVPLVEVTPSERKQLEQHRIPEKDVAEFLHKTGLLFEINRRLLHPLGLALSVTLEQDGHVSGIGAIWDYRDDPEGIIFNHDTFAKSKAKYQEFLLSQDADHRFLEREERLGYVIQED